VRADVSGNGLVLIVEERPTVTDVDFVGRKNSTRQCAKLT